MCINEYNLLLTTYSDIYVYIILFKKVCSNDILLIVVPWQTLIFLIISVHLPMHV